MNNRNIVIYLSVIGLLLILTIGVFITAFLSQPEPVINKFDGRRARLNVETQVAFGSRAVGSKGHDQVVNWIQQDLASSGWNVNIQEAENMGHPIQNIIASRTDEGPTIILGAHYDTRMYADNDPDPANQTQPVPGANDGASGVAVLLELARTLPEEGPPVWLVFFDAEDNGRLQGWDWSLGSQSFVNALEFFPESVVIVDMVGDTNLNIFIERNSNPELTKDIWGIAEELGFDQFIPEPNYSILDDHTPFLQAGIPAALIIDFDYPYWHTTADTADKVSAESLHIVGETLWNWVNRYGK
jgi:Zn-dependent M28 family amino/carboxypeptidase